MEPRKAHIGFAIENGKPGALTEASSAPALNWVALRARREIRIEGVTQAIAENAIVGWARPADGLSDVQLSKACAAFAVHAEQHDGLAAGAKGEKASAKPLPKDAELAIFCKRDIPLKTGGQLSAHTPLGYAVRALGVSIEQLRELLRMNLLYIRLDRTAPIAI